MIRHIKKYKRQIFVIRHLKWFENLKKISGINLIAENNVLANKQFVKKYFKFKKYGKKKKKRSKKGVCDVTFDSAIQRREREGRKIT